MNNDDKFVDKDFNKFLGEIMKEKRLEKKYSLEAVVDKLDKTITRQTLSSYEKNISNMRRNIFVNLCRIYDVSPNQVIEEALKRYSEMLEKKGGEVDEKK